MVLGSKPATGERFCFLQKVQTGEIFFVLQKVQTASGVHPSTLPGSKVTGALSCPLTYLKPKLRNGRSCTSPPPLWLLSMVRDIYTFLLLRIIYKNIRSEQNVLQSQIIVNIYMHILWYSSVFNLQMEAVCFSENMVPTCQHMWCNNQKPTA
jgi:hypothetical protein